ncbi:hypothetical protein [Natronorubrum halophilum]|uniref:hypothetical protein n=1 Tax=Natronorubrum halophilum TaxID=1702106 RepID=UPI000EF722A9|nr:hypothetical protein [Natronorubrum halophilum]
MEDNPLTRLPNQLSELATSLDCNVDVDWRTGNWRAVWIGFAVAIVVADDVPRIEETSGT